MLSVAIVGASGYTGAESVELLINHPHAEVTYLSANSPSSMGPASQLFPRLTGRCDLAIEPLDIDKLSSSSDVVLCCLPHAASMAIVKQLISAGVKVIDLSADYRIKDISVYEKFYNVTHTDSVNLAKAVYGLPELYFDQIKEADLVANPGCYPTGLALAIAPLVCGDLIVPDLIINNAVSGTTGAGKKPSDKFHFPNMNENLFGYATGTHRHSPEMEQIACDLSVSGEPISVLFQPHVGCFDRGILSSVYMEPKGAISQSQLTQLFNDFYSDKPFVQIVSSCPGVKDVCGTNYCHIFPTITKGRVVVFSAIDNLVKGASGQAIQNMNIICGFDESAGLL